jgi:hypothetical protein
MAVTPKWEQEQMSVTCVAPDWGAWENTFVLLDTER